MLNKISVKFAELLLKNYNNEKYDKDIYVYGIEINISTFLILISIIIISMFLGKLNCAIIFIIIFSPLRLYAGGYHSETYSKCFVISNLIFLSTYFLNRIIYTLLSKNVLYMILSISCLYIIIKTPIANKNQSILCKNQKNAKKM